MIYKITAPTHLSTTIQLPSSKSISNRALVISAFSGSSELPLNLSDCDDTDVILRALSEMPPTINIKAAGTSMRFMTVYLAATDSGEHILTGTERMLHRPIGILVDALQRLGAEIDYEGVEGYPPLRIRGHRLEGGPLEISGSVSSQFISALLMAGPTMDKGMELTLTGNIISRPYIDLTLCVMRDFGAQVEWTGPNQIRVSPQPYRPTPYSIENDWSSASYWYEIMALLGDTDSEVRLTGLTDGSKQGDSAARYLSSILGVKTTFDISEKGVPTTVTLRNHGTTLPRFDVSFVNQPDLAQTYIVASALMNIPFHFKGLSTLRIKETDRIDAMMREMRKIGYVLKTNRDNDLYWDGERCTPALTPVIDTYEDHRMALSFAPASIKIPGIRINQPTVVTKSYPHYWDDLRQAGFLIEEE